LLHDIDVEVTGFPTVAMRQQFCQTLLDADGRTYNGVQRFHLILGGNNG